MRLTVSVVRGWVRWLVAFVCDVCCDIFKVVEEQCGVFLIVGDDWPGTFFTGSTIRCEDKRENSFALFLWREPWWGSLTDRVSHLLDNKRNNISPSLSAVLNQKSSHMWITHDKYSPWDLFKSFYILNVATLLLFYICMATQTFFFLNLNSRRNSWIQFHSSSYCHCFSMWVYSNNYVRQVGIVNNIEADRFTTSHKTGR